MNALKQMRGGCRVEPQIPVRPLPKVKRLGSKSWILCIKPFAVIIAGIGASMALAVAAQTGGQSSSSPPPSPPPASQSQQQSHPTRVRVKLEGFDLASSSKHTGANQIGGASRGIGAVSLFAPDKGLAYSLHPTFQWSGSPDTKYKLELEDMAAHTTYDVTVDGTSFTYPETAPPLKPGDTYSWKVQPEIDMMGAPSGSALIVIAGGPEREQIAAALAAITQTGEAGDRARAQVYFDKRVWYDAAEAYSILVSAHPDDPELHQMRGTLYNSVPATEKLAEADFAMAK
jgi:Domain of Unknown Function (DUF928)